MCIRDRGQILHGLVDLRVELVTLGAELLHALASDDGAELVREGLQRAFFQVAVLLGEIEIVEKRQQLGGKLCLRGGGNLATLTLRAPAVVGVFGADTLQGLGALCELQLDVADRAVAIDVRVYLCLLYTSPSPRDRG